MKKIIGWMIFILTILTWFATFFVAYYPPENLVMAEIVSGSGIFLSIAGLVVSGFYLFNTYNDEN